MKKYLIALTVLVCIGQAVAQEVATEENTEIPPGWWQIPKTKTVLKIGGYVKFDLIHDFNPISSPDFFDVSKIPTDGSDGVSSHLNAKETRLFIDTKTPTSVGTIRTYIEGDFYGSGGAFRLRHAFVEINDMWLAGQWWSNFMDESIIPATLDFEKPGAYAFARHAMFRWKKNLSENSYLALAVEEPSTNAQTPTEPGTFESPIPDFTGRYRLTKKWGHIQASAFYGKLQYRYDAGSVDAISLYGINLSGRLNFAKSDYFLYQGLYGSGIGRMRGALSAGLDSNGNIEALPELGFTFGVQHAWTPSLTSLLTYNHGFVDNTEGQTGGSPHMTNYMAANLIWHFTDRAFAGVEYLYGSREDKDEANGDANRLQFSVKYTFN